MLQCNTASQFSSDIRASVMRGERHATKETNVIDYYGCRRLVVSLLSPAVGEVTVRTRTKQGNDGAISSGGVIFPAVTTALSRFLILGINSLAPATSKPNRY